MCDSWIYVNTFSVWALHVQTAFSPFVCVAGIDGLMHILRGLRFEEGTRLCRDSQGFLWTYGMGFVMAVDVRCMLLNLGLMVMNEYF